MLKSTVFWILLLCKAVVLGNTVLFISGRDTGSHQESMRQYFTALKIEGYDVTVLDTSNANRKEYQGVNVEQIYILPDLSGRQEAIKRFLSQPYNGFSTSKAQMDGNAFMMKMIDEKWDELSNILSTPYDLTVIDDIPCVHCTVIATALSQLHGTKIVSFSTTIPLDYHMILMGLTKSPTINPYIFTLTPQNSDDIIDFRKFLDRLYNIRLWVYEMYDFLSSNQDNIVSSAKELDLPTFTWPTFYEKVGFSVIESIDYNVWPIPTLQTIRYTGIHCDPPNLSKIPQDLKDFIEDSSSKGTIYIAFGSYIDFTYAPEHLYDALVNGVQRLSEYRVIVSVKINSTRLPAQSYVRYVDWAPQLEILSHPKTKVFLTHGGLKSLKEAIFTKVPIVIMPMFAEQSANAQLVGKTKIGRILDKLTVDEHVFAEEIKIVAKDPLYKENMVKVNKLWTERPISHLNEVTFMSKKYSNLRFETWKRYLEPKSKTLSVYSTYLLDILGVLLVVLVVTSY